MGKLKLNLDEIKVESFLISENLLTKQGTVIGNMELPKTTQTADTACETCGDNTCIGTCIATCCNTCPPDC